MSAKDALLKFHARDAKKLARMHRKTKNEKPEFEFKKVAKKWLDANGFCCDVVESKAVYNFAAGRYDHGQAKAGFSDIVGVTPYFGVACFIELKAPGKRASLKPHQHAFLVSKINHGAFAVCTDSIDHLSDVYECWVTQRRLKDIDTAKNVLLDDLPKIKMPVDRLSDLVGL